MSSSSPVSRTDNTNDNERPRSGSIEFLLAVAQRKDSGGSSALLDASFLDSVAGGRSRLNSTASSQSATAGGGRTQRGESWGGMSDLSVSGLAALEGPRSRLNSLAGVEDHSSTDMIQGVVASMGDVLSELAGQMENVAGDVSFFAGAGLGPIDSDGATVLASSQRDFLPDEQPAGAKLSDSPSSSVAFRPRSMSTASSTGRLSVDLDAVQAALDAGEGMFFKPMELATGMLLDIHSESAKSTSSKSNSASQQTTSIRFGKRSGLPMKRGRSESQQSAESKKSSESKKSQSSMPLKKRPKRADAATPDLSSIPTTVKTPKISNTTKRKNGAAGKGKGIKEQSKTPSGSKQGSKSQTTAADLKWEAMLLALQEYSTQQGPSWNGNVPTNYVTSDGQLKLGRWVNNQRTSHQKGNLRPVRAERLASTGLKWNVLPANAWHAMFTELKLYIASCEKDGGTWNGNVPTHYHQTSSKAGEFAGEDKNLGRWINRQRSAYSAGKLKPERQAALEELGLKWSMMANTSWDTMYATLQEYVATVQDWDGTVPLTFKTADNRPLGKWVHRQRKAMEAKRLLPDQQQQLEQLGLNGMGSTAAAGPMATTSAEIVEQACKEVAALQNAVKVQANPEEVASGSCIKAAAAQTMGLVPSESVVPEMALSQAIPFADCDDAAAQVAKALSASVEKNRNQMEAPDAKIAASDPTSDTDTKCSPETVKGKSSMEPSSCQITPAKAVEL